MIKSIDESQMPAMTRPDLIAPNAQVGALEPIAVGKQTACQLLSVSPRTIDAMVDRGMPVLKLDGKNLYPIAGMREWVATEATKSKAK